MKKFNKALVTGASRGLGVEIVKALAPRCSSLILMARDVAALETLKKILIQNGFKGEIQILTADFTQKNIIELLPVNSGVDLVINNAGLGFMNHFEKNSQDQLDQMMMVNNYNLTMISHHFVKEMLLQGHGQIINVSSMVGFLPTPMFSVYGATKAYVTSLSQALDNEYQKRGVRVKAICPGGIKTKFHQSAGMTDEIARDNEKFMETPENIAKDILNLIDGESCLKVPRYYNKVMKFFTILLPNQVTASATRKMYSKYLPK